MKLFIDKETSFQINEFTKFVLLNCDEFISTIKRENISIPVGHFKAILKYKIICNNKEYAGESIFDSYGKIVNKIDTNSPYKVDLVNWHLSDSEEKYLEFDFTKVEIVTGVGTFININDELEVKKYNQLTIDNIKKESFNWIKENNLFNIINANYSYYSPGYHDEDGDSTSVIYTNNYEFDSLAAISFNCQIEGKDFRLIPKFSNITINGNSYKIPSIEVFNINPEELNLKNLIK